MVSSMTAIGVCLLTLVQVSFVEAYPTGAPGEACDTMIPGHSVSAQAVASVYNISMSSATYCPKKEVTVTLVGRSSTETFKGFLCQARTSVDDTKTSGSFRSGNSNLVTKNDCLRRTSITHTEGSEKKSAVLKWTPSEGFTSPIFIVCTIVKDKETFWVKQNVEITYAGADNCATDDMGNCNKDADCSGMDGKQCVDGKCTSGAVRTVLVSLILIFVCFIFTKF